jgi:multicomponent Na+:H+ antiporter subunit F
MPPIVSILVFLLLGLGMLFSLLRILIGPTLADRVIALDLLGFVTMGFIAANVLKSGETVGMDIITVAAVILFFGTIVFARYIERRARK